MKKEAFKNPWSAIALTLILTVITGVIYPLFVTALAQLLFPHQANGSLIDRNGNPTSDASQAVGSQLIGQWFDHPRYFWPRPSATTVTNSAPAVALPYNAAQSGGSNLSPAGDAWVANVQSAVEALKKNDPDNTKPIPIDLVTASGSGLDPHISVDAARYQIARIAKARGNITAAELEKLIAAHTEERSLGILGERTVNVLQLNLALDKIAPHTP
ncbi:MAG: potassium-transporting ATPase subunit KdpC [Phycisphaerales bacterium]|nr:potassium-transporting ATPase subunit KdpC [Phycisphaerales bacterium]